MPPCPPARTPPPSQALSLEEVCARLPTSVALRVCYVSYPGGKLVSLRTRFWSRAQVFELAKTHGLEKAGQGASRGCWGLRIKTAGGGCMYIETRRPKKEPPR